MRVCLDRGKVQAGVCVCVCVYMCVHVCVWLAVCVCLGLDHATPNCPARDKLCSLQKVIRPRRMRRMRSRTKSDSDYYPLSL